MNQALFLTKKKNNKFNFGFWFCVDQPSWFLVFGFWFLSRQVVMANPKPKTFCKLKWQDQVLVTLRSQAFVNRRKVCKKKNKSAKNDVLVHKTSKNDAKVTQNRKKTMLWCIKRLKTTKECKTPNQFCKKRRFCKENSEKRRKSEFM